MADQRAVQDWIDALLDKPVYHLRAVQYSRSRPGARVVGWPASKQRPYYEAVLCFENWLVGEEGADDAT